MPPRAAPDYGVVQMAFVHHTVTANDYTPEQSASMVLAIAKYHRDTNGWNDIGYNFLVDQYGQVFEGRAGGVDQAVIGAQAQGYNSQSTGVAVLGTFTAVPIPEAAMASITQLLGWKLTLHGVPCEGGLTIISGGGSLNRYSSGTPVAMQRISGHRDGDSTACPGDALYAQLPELRRRAAALAGPIVAHGEISLQPSADAIDYGADAVFTGTVIRPDSTAGAGEVVALQKRGSGGAWVTVARTTALIDGSWVVRVPWRRGGDVRAVAAGVTSKAIAVQVTPALTTHSTPKRVTAGSSLSALRARAPVGRRRGPARARGRRREVPPRAHRERHPAPDELARRGEPAPARPLPAHGAHGGQGRQRPRPGGLRPRRPGAHGRRLGLDLTLRRRASVVGA